MWCNLPTVLVKGTALEIYLVMYNPCHNSGPEVVRKWTGNGPEVTRSGMRGIYKPRVQGDFFLNVATFDNAKKLKNHCFRPLDFIS